MKSRYLGQSGFLIELSTATLVFDWAQGQLPRLREGIPVYFFISHVHSDHFSPEVFKRAEKLPKVEIYLGYDNSIPNINNFLKGLPGNVASHLHCVDGFKKFKSEDGNLIITTLKSTDMGVAFLVEVEEQIIYHAGDLYLMQAMNKEDYRRWYGEMLVNEPGTPVMDYESQFIHHNNEFFSYTEPLRGKIIDYGMIPLDPRVEGVAHKTLMRYMNIATFKAWSPMHLWGRYEFVENFFKEYPDVVGEMEPFKQPGEYEDEPEVEELETQEAEGKEPSPESEEAMAPQDASVPVPEVDESEAADTSQSVEYLGAIRHLETFDAWGPQDRETFTWARRAKFITLNSITDNPRIGDERNFVRVRATYLVITMEKTLEKSMDARRE